MKKAGYYKGEKQVEKFHEIRRGEPVHIKDILPEVMLDIYLRLPPEMIKEKERAMR